MLTREVPWAQYLNKFDSPYAFFEWRRESEPRLEIPKNLSNQAKSFIQACIQEFDFNSLIFLVSQRIVQVLRPC
jgi:hypothetical protein